MKLSDLKNEGIRVWGLTGGIASGKSTVAQIFKGLGFEVLDADRIARELSQPGGAAHAEIVARFGTADREKIRERVFSEPQARRDLEKILHPLIQEESFRRAKALGQSKDGQIWILYEAALLIETGRYKDLEGIILVTSTPELQRERVTSRDGLPPDTIEGILAAQWPDEEKAKAAQFLIENSGSLADLREQVERVSQQIRTR